MITPNSKGADFGILILRIGLGTIVFFHGLFKITHGVDWIMRPLAAHGLPGVLAYGTYVAEVLAPVLLILGILTRFAALTIAFDLLMAIFLVMRPQLTVIKPGGGWGTETEALIVCAALALVATGGGRYRLLQADL